MNTSSTIPTDAITLESTRAELIDMIVKQISDHWKMQCILIYGTEDGWMQ